MTGWVPYAPTVKLTWKTGIWAVKRIIRTVRGTNFYVFTFVFTLLFVHEILVSDRTRELKMKVFEVTYQPIKCSPSQNYKNLRDYVLGEYTNTVIIVAENKEAAIERFYQCNNGYVDSVRFIEEAS